MSFLQLLREVKKLLKRQDFFKLITLVILSVCVAAFEVIGLGSVPVLLNFALIPESIEEFPTVYNWLAERDLLETNKLFLYGSIAIVGVFIFKGSLKIFVDYLQIKFLRRKQVEVGLELHKRYLNANYIQIVGANSAELIRNVRYEVTYIFSKVLIPLFLITNALITVGIVMSSILIVEPVITTVIVVFLVISVITFNVLFKKVLSKSGEILQELREKLLTFLYHDLNGTKAIRVANVEDFFEERFKKSNQYFANVQAKLDVLNRVPGSYLEVIAVLSLLGMMAILLMTTTEQEDILAVAIFMGLALVRLRTYFGQILAQLNLIQSYKASLTPVINDLFSDDWKKSYRGNDQLESFEELTLQNVYFSYNQDDDILKDISLSIKKKEIIGFAGGSGGGKSTLIDCILGLLVPRKGEVLINGTSVFEVLTSWYDMIGYVPQSISMIDGTIEENIALGVEKEAVDQGLINEVLQKAQLSEFIANQPDGVLTQVGENGALLSGGQKQRIGIARALYRCPQVLILDEATSALDNDIERQFLQDLFEHNDLTIIMIAHRLTTLENCDRIYIMEQGEVTDIGTYETLRMTHSLFMKHDQDNSQSS